MGVVAVFAILVGAIGLSGPSIFEDVLGGNLISPSDAPRDVFPLEIQLEDISILEVDERFAHIELKFKVTNPNTKSIILQLIKYELYENDVRIIISQIGEIPGGMVIGSNYYTILSEEPTFIKDKLTIKNTGNSPELWDALSANTPKWKIKGEASYNLSSITSGGEKIIFFEFTK